MQPAYALHAVVALLDRAAEDILRGTVEVSFSRFLVLLVVERLGAPTQRELAGELGVSEPAVSRTVGLLAESGLIVVVSTAGSGHRKAVSLTPKGQRVVDDAAKTLEARFAELMRAAKVSESDVLAVTTPLLRLLSPVEASS